MIGFALEYQSLLTLYTTNFNIYSVNFIVRLKNIPGIFYPVTMKSCYYNSFYYKNWDPVNIWVEILLWNACRVNDIINFVCNGTISSRLNSNFDHIYSTWDFSFFDSVKITSWREASWYWMRHLGLAESLRYGYKMVANHTRTKNEGSTFNKSCYEGEWRSLQRWKVCFLWIFCH